MSLSKLITMFFAVLLMQLLSQAEAKDTGGDLGQTDVWTGMSPDSNYFAAVRRWPSDDWNYFYKLDQDNFRVAIFDLRKESTVSNIYAKWQSTVGQRIPAQIQWSPNSKYLVMTTRNAGGHHPSICTSYVFCVSDRSFRIIDSAEGEIGDTKFTFVGPDTATMNHSNENMDGDVPFTFSLDKEVPKMKKVSGQ